ncbi:hypothetical protein BCO26_2069 [Heyndrickxia coagulans 2-6]|nr:hypothetical protein BCO26_2069 [Heyndrickxia coagulans 2-6]
MGKIENTNRKRKGRLLKLEKGTGRSDLKRAGPSIRHNGYLREKGPVFAFA